MSVKKWIKQQKLRDLSAKELQDRVAELKAAGFQHRTQRSTGQLENFRVLPRDRRRLAAILTLLRERQLGIGATKIAKEAKK